MFKNSEIRHAVDKCFKWQIPFVAYALPGCAQINFFADNLPHRSSTAITDQQFDTFSGFIFNKFHVGDTLNAYGIQPILSVSDVENLSEQQLHEYSDRKPASYYYLSNRSTAQILYYAQAHSIISNIESDEHKTVLSRMVSVDSLMHPFNVAIHYFKIHPNCFRYLYFTPESGMWIGASPELLIERSNAAPQLFRSMSLAGTRKAGANRRWDKKNKLEHDIVTRFIRQTFIDHGLSVEKVEEAAVKFGDIEHLCHIVEARGNARLSQLLVDLCPTPALCGYPRQNAYEQILAVEAHQRHCYGGFVGLSSYGDVKLYANLRCAMIDQMAGFIYRYNLYGGGGLTARSDYHSEWEETEAKMQSLINILSESKYLSC